MDCRRVTLFYAGALFHTRYRIVRCLATQPRSAVYEVIDVSTGDLCALEVIDPESLSESELPARIEAESRVAKLLDSGHLLRVYDGGIDEETSAHFFVMEFVSNEIEVTFDDTGEPSLPEERSQAEFVGDEIEVTFDDTGEPSLPEELSTQQQARPRMVNRRIAGVIGALTLVAVIAFGVRASRGRELPEVLARIPILARPTSATTTSATDEAASEATLTSPLLHPALPTAPVGARGQYAASKPAAASPGRPAVPRRSSQKAKRAREGFY